MAQDSMQANILAALQDIQTALGGDAQDPIKWLDNFERAATANQYDDKYKFQIVGGYLQGSPATWFSQETNVNIQHRIIRWTPADAEENNTSFTTQFENNNQKVNQPFLALKDNPTINMAIELTQKIEDNQRMHLGSTLPVFAPAPVMAPAPQVAAISFAAQTQDPNEQLINRLTANLARLLEPLAQAVRDNQQPPRPKYEPHFNQPQQSPYQRQQNCGPPVCYCCELTGHYLRDCNNSPLPPPAPRNNDNQNNRSNNNNNVPNQRPNYANINFFEEDSLIEATSESASQPEENPFYAFNLTDDDHNMDELAINTSEPTRKKKKAKVDFVLDSNKASTSAANNNEPPKAKVFKNPPKLETPKIVQKSGFYSIVKDLMETPAHITFGQLMTHPQFRKDLCKSLIPKKKTPKTNKRLCQAGLANNSNVIPLICIAQVAGYFIDLILNSGLSVSVIAKHFLEAIGKKIDEPSTKPMTNVYGNKKKGLGIAKAVSVHINGISIETDMEVSKAKEYTIISDEKEEQEEQEKTVELAYTTFTSNSKPLDNVKANKEGIIVNGKLICWPYYDIHRRTFERKPGKKAKYSFWWYGSCAWCWCNKLLYSPSNKYKSCLIYYRDWEPISLILKKELKEVQKSFENEPPEIQLLVVEQKELFPEEKKIDIENLLARNSPVIFKESDTPGHTHVIQHTITTKETRPIHLKPYQSNWCNDEFIKKEINWIKELGFIKKPRVNGLSQL
ncbi:hypothetical protein G9A89_020624 [Geosiphon pyriformis]|nr:hypothetical protein G9A89_020624 [Geosiphon pyriformis]